LNQIDINSIEYPYRLKQIKDPPDILYFRGVWDPDIFKETLSVVGSRKMTRYGEQITNRLVTDIAIAGITIVSGFMYGIDAVAHGAALHAPGRTIAVMPCGIDRIHPEYQADLHEKIEQTSGLIVSEYPGDKAPALWTYPRRNRIIAGLSPVLLVIEAGLKSGALITANIAGKYNKKIFAVPGPLTSSVSDGTSLLIKEGASIVTESDDLLAEYGLQNTGKPERKKKKSNLKRSQRRIVDLLSVEPMGIDEIIRALQKPASEIGAELTVLCLKKIITLDDGRYSLAGDLLQRSGKC
jgi:DNA processing protein